MDHCWQERRRLFILLLLVILLVSSCDANRASPNETEIPDIPGLAGTLACQTMAANSDLMALLFTPTPPPSTSTPVLIKPSTSTQKSVLSPQMSSSTPYPTHVALSDPAQTPTEVPCINSAIFVKDVTIPDGKLLKPGEEFTKIWRIKNIGTCTWTEYYSIVLVSGDQMGGFSPTAIGQVVQPGETIDLALDMVAPSKASNYRGYWVLQDESGIFFNTENSGNVSFWVAIDVRKPGIASIFKERTGRTKDWDDCGPSG